MPSCLWLDLTIFDVATLRMRQKVVQFGIQSGNDKQYHS